MVTAQFILKLKTEKSPERTTNVASGDFTNIYKL